MILKTIDRFLIKSFVAPFVASFFIALFVLIMQYMWKNISHMAGKGVSFFMIMEILFYMSLSLLPLAIPIAVLLSSVMLFGGAAERFELSSLKSAGVSFPRIALPVLLFCFGLSLFSFYCSNNIIPVANLKFYSRMYDIKKQKPTLSLEEGLFNKDFKGFVIYVGSKEKDNKTIRDIIIYDETNRSSNLYNSMIADSGKMFVSADEQYFIMELYNGQRYEEIKRDGKKSGYPFTTASFEKWTKVFDMSEFDMSKTDEDAFRHHRYMMTTGQIKRDIDSLRSQLISIKAEAPMLQDQEKVNDIRDDTEEKLREIEQKHSDTKSKKGKSVVKSDMYLRPGKDTAQNFLSSFAVSRQKALLKKTVDLSNRQTHQVKGLANRQRRARKNITENTFEIHYKFSLAAMCCIFMLVGAPLGSIVKKGGYGFSLLVAICFFVFFIMSGILFRKLATEGVMHPVPAAWISPLILLGLGIFLTIKASNDSRMFQFGLIRSWISKLRKEK